MSMKLAGAPHDARRSPERHVWGLGRHFIGSNFFWYLRDPAGNFSEYYSDMDSITDDQLWTPGMWEPSLRALYAWAPTCRLRCWSPRTWLI